VTSSVTWPSDSAWALSYWWSMMTMHLSCTWPFDSAYVVSYVKC